MLFRNPGLFIRQILVHIDEPDIFQTDVLLIDHVHKIWILANRTNRTDKNGGLTECILSFDLFHHLICHGFEYLLIIVHDDQLDLWISQKFFFVVIIIIVSHVFPSPLL